ncbi:MAG: 3-deoxy-D-manno-octulosonate 8-phosphate phosphatase [Candidatus Omnitrophica bacterium]|nr:3-deoxy-D-manno-octulosonate 8-phosphate phosphatase [Candidatus Omnitrophota bacterium]
MKDILKENRDLIELSKLYERAKKIKLLMLDVDGVLTNGFIIYDNFGDELKSFNVYDGFGLVLLKKARIPTVIVTAKASKIVKRRARDMQITKIYQNSQDKLKVYTKVLKKFRLKDEEICFIADELIDLSVMKRVGFAVSVPNAVREIRENCHYITKREGGKGAVREVIELILKSQDKWEEITNRYKNEAETIN